MEVKNILALDLATFSGWATLRNGKVKFGSKKFHDPAWDGEGAKYVKFESWLRSFEKFDLIAYEAVMAHSSIYAAHMYGAFQAEVKKLGNRTNTPYIGLHVSSIKKTWTGSGKAKKGDMMKAAWKKGYNVKNDNEADALAVLHMAKDEYVDEWA